MRRLDSQRIGIEDGDTVLFSDFEHNGPMWAGDGPRTVRHEITFSDSFVSPPSVTVGLSMWDISNKSVARMDVQAENVTEAGFNIVFRTWGDTKVARVRVSWRAIGELSHEDNWLIY